MDFPELRFGLTAETPDLLETVPALAKLRLHCPDYIARADDLRPLPDIRINGELV